MEYSENAKIKNWISSFREGDSSAFEKLFVSYRPMLHRALSVHAGGSADAEAASVAYEAFHNAVLAWSEERGATFGTYARVCVVNALKRLAAERAKMQNLSDVDVSTIAISVGIESRLIREETLGAIHECVRKIASPEEYRVYMFCVVSGRGVMEYAKKAGKSRKQVENTKARLLSKIKRNRELFSEILN